jgi:hypothetical protein
MNRDVQLQLNQDPHSNIKSRSVDISVLFQKYILYDLPLFSYGGNLFHVHC